MTPEELEELRALVGRLGANAYDKNLAVVLGAALEHIDQQATRIAELEGDLEQEEHNSEAFMNKIGEHVCEIVDLETKIAELESQIIQQTGISASRMEERERLQKQIATLQEIAEWERASRLRDQVDYETDDEMMPEFCRDARRQLAEEYPEAFR